MFVIVIAAVDKIKARACITIFLHYSNKAQSTHRKPSQRPTPLIEAYN